MQEDFLHYLWKHKKIHITHLKTVMGKTVVVKNVGTHNFNSGPDFFNAQLIIDNQLWAGNVEIHIKSSDWYLHNHEIDNAYNNVILHVVWEHDIEVFREDNSPLATLQLKDFVNEGLLKSYKTLFGADNRWINCENEFSNVNDFVLANWKERLFFERLEQKAGVIDDLLTQSKNDWETVLFKMIFKNFGLKVNGEAFFSLANSMSFTVVRKMQNDLFKLEALLFGQAGLLENDTQEPYFLKLLKEYSFTKVKFNLKTIGVLPVQFFRLRPLNFPTIRLSQLASLYFLHQNLFSKVIEIKSLDEFYKLFKVETSSFWKTHYTFQKESKPSNKGISKSFIDLLLINTIIPLKFCYAKHQGISIQDEILELIASIKSEKNNIISAFNNLKPVSKTALDSQALIHLKTKYCDTNLCLKCAVGNVFLNNKLLNQET
ncbi:hypothetical protein PW52_09095 [Tamlana sedimentorum]|uniref:DUF2851 domain-containing protein n=1 Tax=Neotamlana sedimentorum TaxID=1435349 RepID=A0A0D7W9U5_9FLAO|nr:DUF2851 family protein [Tamlana sedimentorum]KJD35869.1 hypothetical protein PW52_09095 [Tamlana sedimentorum]